MKSSHKREKSEVTHALKSFSVKHSPSVSSFILLFLSVLLYKGSTKPMHSPVKCIFFFFFVVRRLLYKLTTKKSLRTTGESWWGGAAIMSLLRDAFINTGPKRNSFQESNSSSVPLCKRR